MGDDKAAAEGLVSQFQPKKLLNQDQGGRRVVFLGDINGSQAIIMLERAAFQSEADALHAFSIAVTNVENLGANDIYHWYMASSGSASSAAHDLKINLICPCTEEHIKKYSRQGLRMVTETPEIYADHIRPFMQKKREQGRLNWVFNIIEGQTEQEEVIIREHSGQGEDSNGFLLLPDLNWDRKTMDTLHLLALVERRDIWSLRDLKKCHVDWLKNMREKVLDATVKLYPELEKDQLKLYIHYQPTYYHFHIHIVNVMLEAGATQATGKAFGLENLISQLDTISGGPDAGMADVSLSYFLGTANPLWSNVYEPLKKGESPKQFN